jgi:DNA-binding transcriptional LysR family regulator
MEKMNMFNFSDLVVFLEAAECASFSAAGRKLHLSQPAISQKIDNLQKHFGTKLFIRVGRTMGLTESGQALRPMAKELLGVARRLEETMVSLQGEIVGEMTIGCSTASGKYLLPGLIASFRQKYPLVRINVNVTSRASVMRKLLEGDVALGISSKQIDHPDLKYQELFTDNVILIVPAGHPWSDYPTIYPDDILDEPIILREELAGTREVLFDSLRQQDIYPEMLNVVMELGDAEAIEMAVEEGIGVAFVSRLAAARGLDLGKVVEVRVAGMDLRWSIFIVRNSKIPPTRAQIEFWDFVQTDKAKMKLNEKIELAADFAPGD